MNVDPVELARRRQSAGHTTRSLALASGVSQQRISDLEAAPVGILPPTAKALADALGCDVADITDLLDVEPVTP